MLRKRWQLRSRPGATLAVVAVSLIGLLAAMALAVDMGMMYAARNEAQRVADAAALAGASAFLDPSYSTPAEAFNPARDRAYEYALKNYVMGNMVDSSETSVSVDMSARRVTVIINRRQIPTWFAKIFWVDTVAVSAKAVAEAADAGSTKCVVPWALQDRWFEAGGVAPDSTDTFAGNPDPDNYPTDCTASSGDCYNPAVPLGNSLASGYGRSVNDNGTPVIIKTQRPTTGGTDELYQPGPGEFMIWDMPSDPDLAQCVQQGGSTTTSPAYVYRNSICGCNHNKIEIGDTLYSPQNASQPAWHTGNVVGPTEQGLMGMLGPNPISWSEFQAMGEPQSHQQVVKIGLIEPLTPPPGQNWTAANYPPLVFRNFLLMFIDGYTVNRSTQQVYISAHLLYPAPGEDGPVTGSLVRHLRLVE